MSPDVAEVLTIDSIESIWSSRGLSIDFKVDGVLSGQVYKIKTNLLGHICLRFLN